VPSIESMAAPASEVAMLGSVAASPDHETWAYGFTAAPPAVVGGTALPYTAQGHQLVLLRYTDESGWQIQDVLRNPDGSAFALPPAAALWAPGALPPAGEAWMWVDQSGGGSGGVYGLFHRLPGGAFTYDAAATAALGPGLLRVPQSNPAPSLHLAENADGRI